MWAGRNLLENLFIATANPPESRLVIVECIKSVSRISFLLRKKILSHVPFVGSMDCCRRRSWNYLDDDDVGEVLIIKVVKAHSDKRSACEVVKEPNKSLLRCLGERSRAKQVEGARRKGEKTKRDSDKEIQLSKKGFFRCACRFFFVASAVCHCRLVQVCVKAHEAISVKARNGKRFATVGNFI